VILRWLGIVFLALLLLLGGYIAFGPGIGRSLIGMASAYYAKEVCSCLFVVGQSEEYCHDYAMHDVQDVNALPLVELSRDSVVVDKNAKTVSVSILWWTTTARHRSAKLGCGYED
jgi:hypothetical protein